MKQASRILVVAMTTATMDKEGLVHIAHSELMLKRVAKVIMMVAFVKESRRLTLVETKTENRHLERLVHRNFKSTLFDEERAQRAERKIRVESSLIEKTRGGRLVDRLCKGFIATPKHFL